MKRLIYILLPLLIATSLAAQKPHNYYCDFEDETENANWHLNTPKNEGYTWVNQWAIGTGVYSLGEHSMYISPDGGTTVGYGKTTSNMVIAWRELELEAGRYDVAFDWMCGGDSARAALLVAWVPENQFGDFVCKLNDDYKAANWIHQNLFTFNGTELLTGGSVWTHAVTSFVSDGTPHRLVFFFVYSGSAQSIQPGPCVDNIQFARNNCGIPTDMKVKTESQTANLSWTSTGESFSLRLHRMGDNVATVVNDIKQTAFSTPLNEGVYDIQIRVVCEGDTSVWYNFPTAFIHETKCFDYLDLTDERCLFSMETASDYHDNDPLLQPGKIDYGFTSMWSRHTIHYNPDEYDARTYGSIDSEGNRVPALKTVPDGALASVRIGSWEKTARVARVEYDFVVDAKEASVLMLQYAMVLESSGHDEAARPRLTIDIVNAATGKALSPCTTVDLASQTSGDGWFRVPDGGNGSRDVCWRDWTTLGLNLAEFDQTHVKVKITAIGCTAEIHYGYAYFTLTCTSGQLQGLQCGWTPTNEFIAPEGFNYRWYKESMPSETLGRDRTYKVDYRDTCNYAVDVTYKSNKDCGFTLRANAIPRFPIPEATYTLTQHDCGNYITFNNTSHIRTRNWTTGEEIDTPLPPEYFGWSFDGLTPSYADPWSPSFQLPDEEADYHFILLAGVGLCDSMLHFNIHVPRAGKDSIVQKIQFCEGEPFIHNGKPYMTNAIIIDRDFNTAGCDSVHTIDLRFVDVIRDTIEATIPEGSSYTVGKQSFSTSGEYSVTMTSYMGCDSIVFLKLEVVAQLDMTLPSVEQPCPEDASFTIETHANKGVPNFYTLQFDEKGVAAGLKDQSDSLKGGADNTIIVPLPATILPGYYPFTILFDSKKNGQFTSYGELAVLYSSSFIQQRWDDVLGILNADHNGGYNFTSFQWYRNGQAIEGATEPYYYTKDKLQPGDTYSVALQQSGETRALTTCAFVVAPTTKSSNLAVRKIIQNGNIYIIINGRTYNALGVLVKSIY